MAHIHNIYDSNAHFKIDPITRTMKYDSSARTTLVQYDHNSERITFKMPRYIDGHDMSLCNKVEIHYLNFTTIQKVAGVYVVDDLAVDANDEGTVTFTWLVSQNATTIAGSLHFVIRFACLSGIVIDYDWHTEICTEIKVAKGMNNGKYIAEEYVDVLESWKEEIMDAGLSGGNAARVGEVTLLAKHWVGDESPYSQVIAIEGVTKNSQVDLTPSVEQLEIFHEKDLAFVTENDGGVVTIYAIGQKPQNDYTIQVTITEVQA
jgi:hypothetical protein